MSSKESICIPEFGFVFSKEWVDPIPNENALISERAFSSLEKFIAEWKNGEEAVLTLSFHKRYGKIIKAQNYVGIIQTRDGTTIEILPKIHSNYSSGNTRRIFLKMLKSLKDSPFKNINEAHLRTLHFPILEIFITTFLDEVSRVIKKWMKKNYVPQSSNEYFLKWRLKVAENIRMNALHKERFYVEFEEFTEDIAENRLIKSALLKIANLSKNNANKKRIKEYILMFSDIPSSQNIESDFISSENISRLHNYYRESLTWAKIFLNEKSIVSMKGDNIAFSLLFPMEKIFESYVAEKIKKKKPDLEIRTQDRRFSLIESHKSKQKFQLRPDIVIQNENIIMDTKWKIIDEYDEAGNYGISQADMYQLYAYAQKYKSKRLYLIYPQTDKFLSPSIAPFYYNNWEDDRIELISISYDLENDECMIF